MDRGTPPQSSTAIVTVTITDVNDRAPEFTGTGFCETRRVSLSAPNNQLLALAQAADPDSRMLTYVEVPGSDTNSVFTVEANGAVRLSAAPAAAGTQQVEVRLRLRNRRRLSALAAPADLACLLACRFWPVMAVPPRHALPWQLSL